MLQFEVGNIYGYRREIPGGHERVLRMSYFVANAVFDLILVVACKLA